MPLAVLDLTDAITTAFTGLVAGVEDNIAAVAPYGLGIIAAFVVWRIVKRAAKSAG